MVKLSKNRYGKARVRLVKVVREREIHTAFDWTVFITVEGDFEACFTVGDNSRILPTDTMKNTVYSLARNSAACSIEEFSQELIAFFLDWNAQIESVRVEIEQRPWSRIETGGVPYPTAFRQTGPEIWTTAAQGSRTTGIKIQSGLKELVVLKTAKASFVGFIKDSLTTLPEVSESLLCAELSARWTYAGREVLFNDVRSQVIEALISTFAGHDSLSVQHTLYAMGQQALEAAPEISDIKIVMTDRHCLLVDLAPFGQTNPNEIFTPTDEPHSYVEAKIAR